MWDEVESRDIAAINAFKLFLNHLPSIIEQLLKYFDQTDLQCQAARHCHHQVQ